MIHIFVIKKDHMTIRPTLVYVLRCADTEGKYKVGKHTGTREELLSRYTTYINPEIILAYRSANFARIEHEFHKLMDKKRIVRQGFDARNTKTEWYNMPLSEILSVISGLIRQDEAGEFTTPIEKPAAEQTEGLPRTKYGAYWPDVLDFRSALLAGLNSKTVTKCVAYIEDTQTFILNGVELCEMSTESFWYMIDEDDKLTHAAGVDASKGWIDWLWHGNNPKVVINARKVIEEALVAGTIRYKSAVHKVYDVDKIRGVKACKKTKTAAGANIFNKYPGPMFKHMPGLIIDTKIKASITNFLGNEYIINWVAFAVRYPSKAGQLPPIVFTDREFGQIFTQFLAWLCPAATYEVWAEPLETIDVLKCRLAKIGVPVVVIAAKSNTKAPNFELCGNNFQCVLVSADSIPGPHVSPITDYTSAETVFNFLVSLNLDTWSAQTVPKLFWPAKLDSFDHWCIYVMTNKPAKRDIYTIEYLYQCYLLAIEHPTLSENEFRKRIIELGYTIDINIVDWSRRRTNMHALKCKSLL